MHALPYQLNTPWNRNKYNRSYAVYQFAVDRPLQVSARGAWHLIPLNTRTSVNKIPKERQTLVDRSASRTCVWEIFGVTFVDERYSTRWLIRTQCDGRCFAQFPTVTLRCAFYGLYVRWFHISFQAIPTIPLLSIVSASTYLNGNIISILDGFRSRILVN